MATKFYLFVFFSFLFAGVKCFAQPVAAFKANTTTTYINDAGVPTVDFFDQSTNSPTSWSWTFTGGTPSTSSAQNPSCITYSTAGTYDVKLIATNASGSNTLIKTSYITVSSSTSGVTTGTESFSSGTVSKNIPGTGSSGLYPLNAYGSWFV